MSAAVSIIVPVYNVSCFLRETVDSIIAQTFADFELLLIDDGSTDGSGEICDVYAKTDSRIKVYHVNNSGVSAARNFGLDHATGKYIWFVDSDDLVAPRMLQELIKDIENNKADLAMCSFLRMGEEASSFLPIIKDETILINNANCSQILELCFGKFAHSSYCIWDKLFKREIIESNKIRFNVGLNRGEDGLFNIAYFLKCGLITHNASKLYGYRSRSGSLISGSDRNKFQKHLQFYDEAKRLTDEQLPGDIALKFQNSFKRSMMYSVLDFKAPVSVLGSNIKACKNARMIFDTIPSKTRLMKIVFYTPAPICAFILRAYSLIHNIPQK